MSSSRIFSGITYNQFSSRFTLDENYDSYDNIIFITEDEEVTYTCSFEAHENITSSDDGDTTSNFDLLQDTSHNISQDSNINVNNPADIRLQQDM